MKERCYIAIDLKSFYASVECIQRGLDPMNALLVVADESRTEKTICLAVSPALKKYGIPGRPRLFEVVQKVGEVNALRRLQAPGKAFAGKSTDGREVADHPEKELSYIVAPPQMGLYMETSTAIYNIYLKYIAPEDIHVYSIDEVFIDATNYLKLYGISPRELAMKIILDVLENTGITATAGIGTNLYLCKVAMDVLAKKIPADINGVRIAEMDEMKYRRELWGHRPLTDFWRVGRGYVRKLEQHGIFTMGDIARRSVENEELFYKLFGINAELLIDHAWGYESCTIADIKAYRPQSNSVSSGQVLQYPYSFEKAKLVVREMTDRMVLDLVDKGLVTDQIVLSVGYDVENLLDPERSSRYTGEVTVDHYGRRIPRHSHGSASLGGYMASTSRIVGAMMELFDRVADPALLVRRLNVTANHLIPEHEKPQPEEEVQLDLFSDVLAREEERKQEEQELEREKRRQRAILNIQKKYGKNALLKGMNLEEGATARDRNGQIGGHKA